MKFFKFNSFNLEQSSNICAISLTFSVLKLLTSKDVNLLQCANIIYISVTSEVTKEDKPIEVNDEQ